MLRISRGCACACRSATKLPTPAMRTRTPSSRNSRNARFAVMRDTPKLLTMSFSEGTRDEVAHLPDPMLSRMWRFTLRYRGCKAHDDLCITLRYLYIQV